MNGNDEGNRIYVTYLCVEVDGVHVRILLKIIPQKTSVSSRFYLHLSFFVSYLFLSSSFTKLQNSTLFLPQPKKRFLAQFKIGPKTSTTTGETWDDLSSGSSPLEAIFPNVPWGIFYPHSTYLRFIYKIYVKWFIHGAYGMKIFLKWWIFLQGAMYIISRFHLFLLNAYRSLSD